MESNYSQHAKEGDRLKDLITYLGHVASHLTEVKLDKLIYIAHLYHYSDYGEVLTATRFFSLTYGPHAPAIGPAIRDQLKSNAIYLEKSRTSVDSTYSNPCMIIRSRDLKEGGLSAQCLSTVTQVVKDWGEKRFEEILHFTARTIPFLSTAFREHIDFTVIEPFRGLKHALSLPQRVLIHKFVDAHDGDVGQGGNNRESCPISINEVAEIYLALRGGDPEKIPPREHLGFDAQAVLDAFADMSAAGQGRETGGRYAADVDVAAKLTHSLLNSVCFKHYSARVALNAGILFLKRCGYSFAGDALEESWPQGIDYKTFKAFLTSLIKPSGSKGFSI